MTILYFILVLGFLVLIHEWGHFYVARLCGIKVEVFSIGFGPKIFGFRWGETQYQVSIIPLGGYVKIYGQDPEVEADGDAEKAKEIAKSPEAFAAKNYWQKMAVVVAGPAMNIIFCVLILPVIFMMGRQTPEILAEKPVVSAVVPDSPADQAGLKAGDQIIKIESLKTAPVRKALEKIGHLFFGEKATNLQNRGDLLTFIAIHADHPVAVNYLRDGQEKSTTAQIIQRPCQAKKIGYLGVSPRLFTKPHIDQVAADLPAKKAGLKAGDIITKINGKSIEYSYQVGQILCQNKTKPIQVEYQRDSETLTAEITPVFNERQESYLLGVAWKADTKMVTQAFDFGPAIYRGLQETWHLFSMSFVVLERLATLDVSVKQLSGPVGIAQMSGQAVEHGGLVGLLYFMALLSMNLAILNLLPIPMLDGGHAVFLTLEAIIRRPIPLKIRQFLSVLGFVVLITLMVVVTFQDIRRLIGF